MDKVFIVVPGNTVTGGPELCHQLADTLNQTGKRAFILYYPFNDQFETPTRYRRYNTYTASRDDVEPGSIVVMPEVYGSLVGDFPDCVVYFWWLSVGNYFKIVAPTNLDTAPSANVKRRELQEIRRHAARHLYQSDYARTFLESMSMGPTHRLSDQLGDGYLEAIAAPPGWPRQDLVVYNPAKGLYRTRPILGALEKQFGPKLRVLPLAGMNPYQLRNILGRAKVYMDFGGHPGKDRLPREAAAYGCCVVTNRRGAAGNSVDVPIPDDCKIDDKKPGFERRAARKIMALVTDYDRQAPRFDPYRKVIAAEPAAFAADVAAVFPQGVS